MGKRRIFLFPASVVIFVGGVRVCRDCVFAPDRGAKGKRRATAHGLYSNRSSQHATAHCCTTIVPCSRATPHCCTAIAPRSVRQHIVVQQSPLAAAQHHIVVQQSPLAACNSTLYIQQSPPARADLQPVRTCAIQRKHTDYKSARTDSSNFIV